MPSPKPPVGVAIRAYVVIAIGTVLTLIATFAVIGVIIAFQLGQLGPQVVLFALLALILSIAVLASGIGLYNLRPWAWWVAVIALLLQVFVAVGGTGLVSRSGLNLGVGLAAWLALLIPTLSLLYMVSVRRHFR